MTEQEVRRVVINGIAHDSRYDVPKRMGPWTKAWLILLSAFALCFLVLHMAYGQTLPIWAEYPKPTEPATIVIHNGGLTLPDSAWSITWPGGSKEKPSAPQHQRIGIGMACDWWDVDLSPDKIRLLVRCMRHARAEDFGPPVGTCPPDFSPAPRREPWPSCKLWKGTGLWD